MAQQEQSSGVSVNGSLLWKLDDALQGVCCSEVRLMVLPMVLPAAAIARCDPFTSGHSSAATT
jgi:hypothetical protein